MPRKKKQGTRRLLYQRTAEKLASLIDELEDGDRLPSEPSLAVQLGVSRATLREAMRTFENQGRVIRRQGVGTYVAKPIQIMESGLEVLESIETLAARIGLIVDMGNLSLSDHQPSPEERQHFQLEGNGHLIEISRVILTENRPVAFLVDILPWALLPFEPDDKRFKGSILDMFLKNGHPSLAHSRADITAVPASTDIAHHLRIQRGDVLMKMESWLYAKERKVIDHTYSYFLPGTFRFHIMRRIQAA